MSTVDKHSILQGFFYPIPLTLSLQMPLEDLWCKSFDHELLDWDMMHVSDMNSWVHFLEYSTPLGVSCFLRSRSRSFPFEEESRIFEWSFEDNCQLPSNNHIVCQARCLQLRCLCIKLEGKQFKYVKNLCKKQGKKWTGNISVAKITVLLRTCLMTMKRYYTPEQEWLIFFTCTQDFFASQRFLDWLYESERTGKSSHPWRQRKFHKRPRLLGLTLVFSRFRVTFTVNHF